MDRIVVIGASQGGVEALRKVASGLPDDFPTAVLAVSHIGVGPSSLPSILTDVGPLPARHAKDGEEIQRGCIYIAPPDRHMLVADHHIELTRGPRENFARPAVDPLFRSAAELYGAGAIGVVLTGRLNDGTSGLYEIKRRGGLAVVQDPSDAEQPSMPLSVIQNVAVDHCLPVSAIPDLLARLVRQEVVSAMTGAPATMTEMEAGLSMPPAQTCPECGGVMIAGAQGALTRFRCHIGHVMTAEILAAAQAVNLEKELDVVLRTLNERVALCRDMAERCAARGDDSSRALWTRAADEAARRERSVRDAAEAPWMHPEAAPEPQQAS